MEEQRRFRPSVVAWLLFALLVLFAWLVFNETRPRASAPEIEPTATATPAGEEVPEGGGEVVTTTPEASGPEPETPPEDPASADPMATPQAEAKSHSDECIANPGAEDLTQNAIADFVTDSPQDALAARIFAEPGALLDNLSLESGRGQNDTEVQRAPKGGFAFIAFGGGTVRYGPQHEWCVELPYQEGHIYHVYGRASWLTNSTFEISDHEYGQIKIGELFLPAAYVSLNEAKARRASALGDPNNADCTEVCETLTLVFLDSNNGNYLSFDSSALD